MKFPGLIIVVTLCILLAIRLAVLRSREKKGREAFWDRERNADLAPARDISDLPYIEIPYETLPLDISGSPEEAEAIAKIRGLSGKRILGLSGQTNTDLKEAYGRANLAALEEAGDNFDTLVIALVALAKMRLSAGDPKSAVRYLEYGMKIRSDIAENYILLADCYQETGQTKRIRTMLEYIPSLHLPLERKVTGHLRAMLPEDTAQTENFTA